MNYLKKTLVFGMLFLCLWAGAVSVSAGTGERFDFEHFAPKAVVETTQLTSVISPLETELVTAAESINGNIIRNRDGRNITAPNATYPNDRVARSLCQMLWK